MYLKDSGSLGRKTNSHKKEQELQSVTLDVGRNFACRRGKRVSVLHLSLIQVLNQLSYLKVKCLSRLITRYSFKFQFNELHLEKVQEQRKIEA